MMSKTLSTKTLKLNHPTCFLRSAHSHSFPTLCPSGKAAAVATAVAASRQALLGKEVVDCGVGDTGCHSSYITKKTTNALHHANSACSAPGRACSALNKRGMSAAFFLPRANSMSFPTISGAAIRDQNCENVTLHSSTNPSASAWRLE